MNNRIKVSVNANFDMFGNLTPAVIIFETGKAYEINKVLDQRRAVSLKAGGSGIRYTCKINGKLIYLYYDDNLWYLER